MTILFQIYRRQTYQTLELASENPRKPIYGLVFLFEHTGEQASLDTGPEDCDFWFANQVGAI